MFRLKQLFELKRNLIPLNINKKYKTKTDVINYSMENYAY